MTRRTGSTSQWRLRAAFAARLSEMYGREVPAYTTLLDVSREVNEEVLREQGADAERLGSIGRVTAERHGAIRVGTPEELAQVARVFGAVGMHPVGFYDLRDTAASAVPVVSTAFRPVDRAELARNPFRVFTSLLTPADPRFFDDDLRARVEAFLAGRELFPPELLASPTAPRRRASCRTRTPSPSCSWPCTRSNCPPNRWTGRGTGPWSRSLRSPRTSPACDPHISTISLRGSWTSTSSTAA